MNEYYSKHTGEEIDDILDSVSNKMEKFADVTESTDMIVVEETKETTLSLSKGIFKELTADTISTTSDAKRVANKAYVDAHATQMPKRDIEYSSEIIVEPNTVTDISILTDNINITLSDIVEGYDNEWIFVISQGETAYEISLPEIHWGLGISPTFIKNSITRCCLYYIGNTLCGEWVSI